MPEREVLVSMSSNNPELEGILLENKLHSEIKFARDKKSTLYKVFLIDIQKDLTQISQNLIDIYGASRENDSKLVVILLHGEEVDIEKNHYFQKMLDDLGKDTPLHRLVFTKDIYQHLSSTPATPLDFLLFNAITKKRITISEKGENLLYPLSLEDFINALVKTLFLNNTSGKSFWLLGDSITDLELSYLLKKNTEITGQDELEINASGKNDLKTNSLLSLGNKARAELSWQPEREIIDDLKQLINLYKDTPSVEEKSHEKRNPLYRFLNWVYKPRAKNNTGLPTIKKIGVKLLITVVAIYLILGGISAITTILSLQQLESSINHALNGNLQKSVSSLENSTKLKEIGESTFAPIIPMTNVLAPKWTEKIFNLYNFIDYGASSLENLHQTYTMAETLLLSLNNKENKPNYADLSLALHSNLSQIYENLNQIFFLSNGNKLPTFLDNKLRDNREFQNLKTLESQVVEFIKIVDIIPAILGSDRSKNILVLLQNSHVLRPSGGEPDYYLLLTISQGNLISKKYFTGGELDVLYPKTLATLSKNSKNNSPRVTLDDLAQLPDFSIYSTNISSYLEKTIKTKPDFVVSTNDLLIKQLLTEEKSLIADQFETDLVSSSGSAVYKDLADQYIDRLFGQNISLPVLGRTMARQIGDNQLLLWSADMNIEHLIAAQSYSGVISFHPCNAGIDQSDKCIAQTSYLSESDTQPSRESPWTGRLVSHTINMTATQIKHEYQVDYKPSNMQNSNSPVSSVFNLYLPSPSTLDKVLLNDLPSSMKEITKISEGLFDQYTIPLVLNSGQNTKVLIDATTLTQISPNTPLSYSITEYRQPGTTDAGIILKILYSENLKPAVVTSAFTAQPAQMSLNMPQHTSTFGFTLNQNIQ